MEQSLGWSMPNWTAQSQAAEPREAMLMRGASATGLHATGAAMEAAKPCSERRMLWEDFRQAFRSHVAASGMIEAIPSDSGDSVARAKQSRADLENRWDAFYRHLVEHGCRNELLPFGSANDPVVG